MSVAITYPELQRSIANLMMEVVRATDAIRTHGLNIAEEASETAQLADGIAAIGVDRDTVAETTQLSRIMDGLSDSARVYTAVGDTTSKAAEAAYEQNLVSHGGIGEAVSRSPVDVSNLDREWLRQE
ncbi:hypothetical protein ACIOEX_01490 [Streptomyces sp. NPDC087850]|uniref:hypothetical protein n=1 Tax=Streptomyces sp. NPDC087850 TaxID=3365809 RepID=UPI00382AE98B